MSLIMRDTKTGRQFKIRRLFGGMVSTARRYYGGGVEVRPAEVDGRPDGYVVVEPAGTGAWRQIAHWRQV